MAEFCLECFNKIFGTSDSGKKYIISKDLDLCEGCGNIRPVVVRIKRRYLFAEALIARIDYMKMKRKKH